MSESKIKIMCKQLIFSFSACPTVSLPTSSPASSAFIATSEPSSCTTPMASKPRQTSPELDQLEREELKNSMELVLATLKCPVCLVLLEKESILCINGHIFCKKCLGKQTSCPTCRSSLSNIKQNAIISQVLETIPHRCRFEKCSHLVKSGEDHELYCRYRPTNCRYSGCQWIGTVENISFHLEDKHPTGKIFSASKNLVKIPKHYDDALLFSTSGHYFWQCMKHYNVCFGSSDEALISFTYLPVFVGKPTRDIYIRIWFKSEEKEYDAGLKIKMNNNNDATKADRFIIPVSMISNFYIGNDLKYQLMINEERKEPINMLLE